MRISDQISDAKIVVLTGAGASVPLGLFTTAQFLADFRESDYRRLSSDPDLTRVLNWVLQEANENGFDIEDLLDLLVNRREAVNQLLIDGLFVRDVVGNQQRPAMGEYGALLGRMTDAIADKVIEHYSSIDVELAGALYRPLFREFRSWFARLPDLGFTLPFFTLNYDMAVEAAARQLGDPRNPSESQGGALPVRLVDGIVEGRDAVERRWSRAVFEDYEEDPDHLGVVLVKLHGSVRWGRRPSPNGPDLIVELTPGMPRNPGQFETAVQYPTLAAKPITDEPFRTGYRMLRACLRRTQLLIVIGTTLRDAEIVSELRDAIEDNENLHVVWVGPHVKHETLLERIGGGADRLAALRGAFEVSRSQIESSFPGGLLPNEWLMGCLRKLAWEAYRIEQIAGGPYFGKTLVCDRTAGLGRARTPG